MSIGERRMLGTPKPNASLKRKRLSESVIVLKIATSTRRGSWSGRPQLYYNISFSMKKDVFIEYMCPTFSRVEDVHYITIPSSTNRYVDHQIVVRKKIRSLTEAMVYEPIPKHWRKFHWQEDSTIRWEPNVGQHFEFMNTDPDTRCELLLQLGIIRVYYPPALIVYRSGTLKGKSIIETAIRGD